MRFIFVVMASLLIAACGEGFSGIYEDKEMGARYEFKKNGKVTLNIEGIEKTADFKRDGNTLRLTEGKNPTEALVLTLKDDGNTITGAGGLINIKKVKK